MSGGTRYYVGIKNLEQAKEIVLTVLENTREAKSVELTPGYIKGVITPLPRPQRRERSPEDCRTDKRVAKILHVGWKELERKEQYTFREAARMLDDQRIFLGTLAMRIQERRILELVIFLIILFGFLLPLIFITFSR